MSSNPEEVKKENGTIQSTNKKTVFKDKTMLEKLCFLKSNITVEPMLAGLIIPSIFTRLAMQNLNLDKACRLKFDFGDEICDALIAKKENMTYYEAEVQKIVSTFEAWKSILLTSVPTILVVVMGAWSDRSGNRKPSILAPFIGEFMVCLCNILSTAFFYEIPVEATMFFEAFFPAISGGWVMEYLGVFSYISDITTEESRTFRVGMANLCLTVGIQVGTALSGVLVKYCGYYGTFSISASLYLITFLYGYFCLNNNTKASEANIKKRPRLSVELKNMIKETVQVAFQKRPMRKMINLTLLAVVIIYGPEHGQRGIKYLYTRYRLRWDALKYSLYSTCEVILNSLGALFSITVFSKCWSWHDSMLCLISITSKFVGCVYISLVQTDLQMYLFPIVTILDATTFTSLRSMATKLVNSEEIGKMNSLFSLVETLAALVFDPTYSTIYANTLTSFSGAVFIFSAFMILPAIVIMMWVFKKHREDVSNNKLQQEIDLGKDGEDNEISRF